MEIKTSLEIDNLMSTDNLKWRNDNYKKKWVAVDSVVIELQKIRKTAKREDVIYLLDKTIVELTRKRENE